VNEIRHESVVGRGLAERFIAKENERRRRQTPTK